MVQPDEELQCLEFPRADAVAIRRHSVARGGVQEPRPTMDDVFSPSDLRTAAAYPRPLYLVTLSLVRQQFHHLCKIQAMKNSIPINRDLEEMLELRLPGAVQDEALCFLPAEFAASTSGSSLWAIGESSERERKPF
ncbi:hypothetical protein VNO77_04096 [Canavalia gladiata]|uniref:Uncharacterized protein n=1 Tax=Canavalia gladiata TaxID=3824 RepID=A0AAN9R8R4_CANGL